MSLPERRRLCGHQWDMWLPYRLHGTLLSVWWVLHVNSLLVLSNVSLHLWSKAHSASVSFEHHNRVLSEVTHTPCSNSRPCPDGGPCLEYGGTYLCTCQTSGAELDHRDYYSYGKNLGHQHNNRAATVCVIAWAAGYYGDTHIFEHTASDKCHFPIRKQWSHLQFTLTM